MRDRSEAIFEKLSDLKAEFIIEADSRKLSTDSNVYHFSNKDSNKESKKDSKHNNNNESIDTLDKDSINREEDSTGGNVIDMNTDRRKGYLFIKIAVAVIVITTIVALVGRLMKSYNDKIPAVTLEPSEKPKDKWPINSMKPEKEETEEKIGYEEYLESIYTESEIEEMRENSSEEITILEEWYSNVYGTKCGYIRDIDLENNNISINEVEWISDDDEKRIQELNLDPDSFPNGFYIYDEKEEYITYNIDDNINFFAGYYAVGHIKEDIKYVSSFEDAMFTYSIDNDNNIEYLLVHILP